MIARSGKVLLCLFVLCLNGCTTGAQNFIAGIPPGALEQKGAIVGRIIVDDVKRQAELGSDFKISVEPAFSKGSGTLRRIQPWVNNSDKGYFLIVVKPDTYTLYSTTIHLGFSRFFSLNMTDKLEACCFKSLFEKVTVRPGEMVYVGDIHYRIIAKDKEQQIKEGLKTGPLAAIFVPGAAFNDHEYLDLSIRDNFEAAKAHLEQNDLVEKGTLVKRLLAVPEPGTNENLVIKHLPLGIWTDSYIEAKEALKKRQ